MKSVKVEAFIEMMKLIGCAVVGAGVAYLVINFLSLETLFTALVVGFLASAFYSLFRAQCIIVEMRRDRAAREAAEKKV